MDAILFFVPGWSHWISVKGALPDSCATILFVNVSHEPNQVIEKMIEIQYFFLSYLSGRWAR
jgi:hypothetical protein